jgi:hypothetical protein
MLITIIITIVLLAINLWRDYLISFLSLLLILYMTLIVNFYVYYILHSLS